MAFEELSSVDWWFRKHYDLPPTDPRYLDMTAEQIEVEFWLHRLDERLGIAIGKKQEVQTLDDLLMPLTVEEKIAELEREDEEEDARAVPGQGEEPPPRIASDVGDLEEIISFRAEED